METNSVNCYNFNYKEILMDEIALEGLEGMGINLLWSRLAYRTSNDVTEKMRIRLWAFLVNSSSLEMYQLPAPAPNYEIRNRFELVEEGCGHIKNPDIYLDGPYECNIIEGEYGSCQYYDTRTLIPKSDLSDKTYIQIMETYGEKLVMVASIEERWHALAPHAPIKILEILSPVQYVLLELIGRGRQNGQMTVGTTNMLKIAKDPKILFYYRKRLEELDLVNVADIVQFMDNKGFKSILIRLKRFYMPKLISTPKKGVLHEIINHLKKMPGNKDSRSNLISLKLIDQKLWKRLHKKANVFKIIEPKVGSNYKSSSVCLNSESEESVNSDEESNAPPVKYQYRVGVGIFTQAYGRMVEAGRAGLTQRQLGQLLGVGFYTARTICRSFKARNLVRKFLEDNGRQRTARFVAITATGEEEDKYTAEKRKLLDYLATTKVDGEQSTVQPLENPTNSQNVIPPKRRKLDIENQAEDNHITELKLLTRFDSATFSKAFMDQGKVPTFRQIQLANIIIKTIRDNEILNWTPHINRTIVKETGSAMDQKSLKRFISKLAADGQLRIYSINWPGIKNTILFCAPHITKNHPQLIAASNKIYNDAKKVDQKHEDKKKRTELSKTKLSFFTYSRYLRVRKLHEFMFNLIYLNPENVQLNSNPMPEGFASLAYVIPEMPLSLAVGHISVKKMYEMAHLNISKIDGNIKLRDAPLHVFQTILKCNSFSVSLKSNIQTLANFGLIQVFFETNCKISNLGDLQTHSFYINRNAKIIDTHGIWPRDTADLKSLEINFHFKNMDDVLKYWTTVNSISLNTNIQYAQRSRNETLSMPNRSFDTVKYYDNGDRMGDGCGPCGFHSSYFLDIPQLWQLHSILACKVMPKKPKPKVKPVKDKKSKPSKKIMPKNKLLPTKTDFKKSCPVKLTRKRYNDKIITWTKWDDNIIMLVKAAINIMSPSIQPGSLQVTNMVSKDLLSIKDPSKTIVQCFKRGRELDMNSSFVYEKQKLINEIRQNQSVVFKYEGVLRKLRLKHSMNIHRYLTEARCVCMELVWIIEQMANSDKYTSVVPCITLSLKELHQKYSMILQNEHKFISLYRSSVDCPVIVATIKEGIMLVVSVEYVTELTKDMSMKVYNIFKDCMETHLRMAKEQLHRSGAISLRDKAVNCQLQHVPYNDMVKYSVCYKLSSLYKRRWVTRLNSNFADKLYNLLDSFAPTSHVKANSEISCFLCELNAVGAIKIVRTTLPSLSSLDNENSMSYSDFDMKSNFKSGNIGWENISSVVKVKDLFKEINYKDAIVSLIRNATVYKIDETDVKIDGALLTSLDEAAEKGKTFQELLDITGYEESQLKETLSKLEDQYVLKRVGYCENYIVLSKYLQSWCLKMDNIHLIPSPWFLIGNEIVYTTFLNWCNSVMDKVYKCPGSSITTLANCFDYITPRSVQEICMFLERSKCVKLNTLCMSQPTLFSEDDLPNVIEFNEYEKMDNLIVFPVKDSFLKIANLRHNIKQFCAQMKKT